MCLSLLSTWLREGQGKTLWPGFPCAGGLVSLDIWKIVGYTDLIDDKSLETSGTKMNQPASIVEGEA